MSQGQVTRLRAGGATDIGQLREINQDSFLITDDVAVVADGMGGHVGGEVASALAVRTIGERFQPADVVSLAGSIQDANRVIVEQAREDTGLHGMGTTVVAVAVVVDDDDEEVLAIANVGDSRAYLFVPGDPGQLGQVTDDHSLVGELVREGRITEDEAALHPQRNIVTRALGIDRDIPPDLFFCRPVAGDRYLLCSDGLTNEVDDAAIAEVLATIDDPEAVATRLVEMANEGGGRDNITVVVVDVVDAPEWTDDEADSDVVASRVLGSGLATALDEDGEPTTETATQPLEAVPPEVARPPRAVTARSAVYTLVVVAIVGVAVVITGIVARGTFQIAVVDDALTVVKGRSILFFEPTETDTTLAVPLDEITSAERNQYEGTTFGSQAAAEERLVELADAVAARDDEDESDTTTSTVPGVSSSTTPTVPGASSTTPTSALTATTSTEP